MAAPPLLVAAWSVLALFKPEGELGAELELRGGSAPSATGQGAALQLRSTATPYAEARLRSRRLTSQLRYAPRFTWQLPAVGAAWDPIVYHHVLFGHAYRVSRRLDHTVSVAVSGGELDYVGAVDELGELGEALPSVDDAARLDLALATGLRFAFSRRQTLSTDLDARYGGPSGRQAFVSALGGDTADDVTLVAAFSTSASVGYEVALGRASSLSALGTVGWHSFSTGSRLLFAPASVGVTRRWGERTRTSALLGAGYLRVWTPLATEATEATEATLSSERSTAFKVATSERMGIASCDTAGTVADSSLDRVFASDEISLALTMNRHFGVAPLAVFFDATETTHSDTSVDPFFDLHYQWYFHDDAASSSGVWEYSCKSKQVASGPMAAHVFDQPGVYAVRLAVRDRAGNTASQEVTVTVESPDVLSTYCIADIASGGDFSGCPLDIDGDGRCNVRGRCVDTNDVLEALEGRLASRSRLLFRRGDVFRAATLGVVVRGQTGIIGAFGSEAAARPIWQYQETVNDTIMALNFRKASDWRFMDIDLVGDPKSEHSVAAFEIVDARNVLLYRVRTRSWRGFGLATHFGPSTRFSENVFIVDVSYEEQLKPGGGWAAFLELERSAVMGLWLEDTSGGEGGYRTMHSRKFLLQHSRIERPAPFKQNISIRSCDSEPESYDDMCTKGLPTEEIIVSDNVLVATEQSGAMNVPPGPHRRYIIERNFVQNDERVTSDYLIAFQLAEIDGLAFRNNIVDLTVADGGGKDVYMITGVKVSDVYNNTLYWKNDGGIAILCGLKGGRCLNNLLYAPGSVRRVALEGKGDARNNVRSGGDERASPFAHEIPFPSRPHHFIPVAAVIPEGPPLPGPVAIDDFFGRVRAPGSVSVGAVERAP